MIASGLRSFDISFLDGNMFRQVTITCTNYFVMISVDLFKGMEWHPHVMHYLIVWINCLMYPMFSFGAHVCIYAGDKVIGAFRINCHHVSQ